ncbi:efflux transporter outer membrane subunit [Sphingomonas hylomeconis]|uniref:Efflux transporter outer membrane subunit n=1 Tax=Sphingomonas hylomeconis TaxID=1395958 RepID=A0ABV7T1G6_9SPHN|nr:efflux transporter outer membrane subunit [Sphingomonas hylomeconis]
MINRRPLSHVRRAPLRSALLATALLAGCTVGPNYQRPQIATPPAWIAPVTKDARSSALSGWWQRFDDPTLLRLQQQAEAFSPTLDQAVARILQARATLDTNRAQGAPTLNAGASYTESGQRSSGSGQSFQVTSGGFQPSADASWTLDLFGKIRRNNEAARARIEARGNDLADARIALAAEVADDYVQYRGCEQLADLYDQQAKSQAQTARLTRISQRAGFTAPADAELTDASAASVRASYTDQVAQCDLLVKSLTSLTGSDEAALRAMLAPGKAKLPMPATLDVTTLPADLVRQRPDIASAERELAASNAEIGAATADLYPSLSLSGSISAGGGLTQWSFGPSLSLPILDGGKARAGVRSARAGYDLQFATYRESVRAGIVEVEQALVRLQSARGRDADLARSAQGYAASFAAIDRQREVGSVSMIERESARRNALDAQRKLVDLRLTQVRELIALYKALGGGWDATTASTGANT